MSVCLSVRQSLKPLFFSNSHTMKIQISCPSSILPFDHHFLSAILSGSATFDPFGLLNWFQKKMPYKENTSWSQLADVQRGRRTRRITPRKYLFSFILTPALTGNDCEWHTRGVRWDVQEGNRLLVGLSTYLPDVELVFQLLIKLKLNN